MFKSYDEYVIKIYSPQKALQLLKEKKIVVRNFKKYLIIHINLK